MRLQIGYIYPYLWLDSGHQRPSPFTDVPGSNLGTVDTITTFFS